MWDVEVERVPERVGGVGEEGEEGRVGEGADLLPGLGGGCC